MANDANDPNTEDEIHEDARYLISRITGNDPGHWPDAETAEHLIKLIRLVVATPPAPATDPGGPFAPGELTEKAHAAADAMREQHKTPVPDEPVCGWLSGDAVHGV